MGQISLGEETIHSAELTPRLCSATTKEAELNKIKLHFGKDSPLVNFCFSHSSLFPFLIFVQVLSLLLIAFLVLLGALYMPSGSGDMLSRSLMGSHFPW